MDVDLPDGAITILVIDTTAYSGNFERELCAYATGLWSEDMFHGEFEAAKAMKADAGIVARIQAKSEPLTHSDHGTSVVEAIRATPGRVNDGMGLHMDTADAPSGAQTYPAYESVAIFLSAPLDAEELAFVTRRAAEYATLPTQGRHGAWPPFGIRDVYQVERTAGSEERRLS